MTTPAAAARRFDKKYWATYKVLDILQKVFYRSNPAREAFVEMCESDYVQKMTFDSYLYKTVVPGNPLDDVKLLVQVRQRCAECFCFASPFPAAPWPQRLVRSFCNNAYQNRGLSNTHSPRASNQECHCV